MAMEFRRIEFAVTTKDYGDLPDGMNADDVVHEIHEVMAKAATAWYRERGHELLAHEPEFAWGRGADESQYWAIWNGDGELWLWHDFQGPVNAEWAKSMMGATPPDPCTVLSFTPEQWARFIAAVESGGPTDAATWKA